ncbi:hypothetical protein EGH24_04195 [Halonotius terrestris]|uniref:Uncharacterized protein n=1 Tax=Halonotius terrestris TaxID=2487750 RepID=A0A8J8PCG8_9EURY|nr:hypothetical protein [Halonotius terrestris]TQQ82657.1 hypothetical protein EGH24_04195 [Halonotius terrestris]
MTGRRELLFGVAGSLSVAGCLGSVSGVERGLSQADSGSTTDSEADGVTSESENEGTDSDTAEGPPKGLPNFTVENIELNYASHVGITTLITIKNETDHGSKTAHLVAEAHDGDGVLGSASCWDDIPTLTRPVELRIENIFDLYGNLGSISEFVIKGRVPEGEYGVIKSFSGSGFRDEVGVEDVSEDDGEVEVDVESGDETEDDSAGGDATNETETDGSESGDGGGDDSSDGGGSLADELDVNF